MTKDPWWKHSKAPVLLVRRDIDRRLAWQANEAAMQWARQHEFDEDDSAEEQAAAASERSDT